MAKVKAPLFSFEARGKLADALVYFPWKGIDAVRTHVIPANPQTAAQITQRGYMTGAVAAWHAASYLANDIAAWNRLANLAATSRSGFNRMVEEWINEAILGGTWEPISDVLVTVIGAAGFQVNLTKASGGNAPTLRWGTSPTNMPENNVMTDNTLDDWEYAPTGLNASTLYYFTVDVGATGVDWARLGIYTQRTTA
ncbi:hypothetical protein LCGC14_1285780 [marine sediment metagenome]|uniref:Uncharacterized protein n=1 Tax=marine sediment metagenome TaxID=412755 RepID=A0A0F9KVL5_9ZZZZ